MRRFFAFLIALVLIGFFTAGLVASIIAPNGILVMVWLIAFGVAVVCVLAWWLSDLIEGWLYAFFPARAKTKKEKETDY